MSGWIHDVAHAIQSFRRAPLFFAGLIVILALGTGANGAIFSLVHAVILQPLPYSRPEEVVLVWNATDSLENWRHDTTKETVLAWRDSSDDVFSDLAVIRLWDSNRDAWIDLVLDDRAERLRAGLVTSNFFRVLGVSAAIGRVFSPEDEAAGRTDLIVLSEALWRRAFASDPSVVGRRVTLTTGDSLDRRPRSYLVLGVLGPMFKFTYPLDTELWTLNSWAAVEASPGGAIMFNGAVARLNRGVPLAVAAARMADVPARLNEPRLPMEQPQLTRLEPISEWVVGTIRPSLLLLGGTSLILLVITCATVASALLVRLAERQRELAVRVSLGASRFRVARQAVTEVAVLSMSGTAAGLLLAVSVLPVFRGLVPSIVPRGDEIAINLWLLLFAAATACLVATLSALVPALQASRIDVASTLKRGSGTISADERTRRLRSGLVMVQTGITTSLLVVSALLVISFWRLGRVDVGFDGQHVVTVEMRLREPKYFKPGVMGRLQDDLVARVRAIPGVSEAGLTTAVPFRGTDLSMSLTRTGTARRTGANARTVDEAFFSIMKIPLQRGRLFTTSDRPTSRRVAIVSESFSRRLFDEENAIGQTFDLRGPVEIVGVVGDIRYASLAQEARPAVYFARSQQPSELMCLVLRVALGVPDIASALRTAIHDVDPALPPMHLTTIDRIVSDSVADRRFYTTTAVAFTALALLLTITALIIVITRVAVERRRELAIRAALGAPTGQLIALVARQSAVPVTAGAAAGLIVAWFGTRILQQFLFEVDPREPLVYAGTCLVTLAVAALSSFLPAWRMGTLPPAAVLRAE